MTSRRRWDEDPWLVGWVAGGAVVALAAGLLVTITVLARRIAGQAEAVRAGLEAARHNVEPLLDLGALNTTLATAVESVEGSPPEPVGAGQRRGPA